MMKLPNYTLEMNAPILVAGGGIAGLAMALALNRCGFDNVRVIEAKPDHTATAPVAPINLGANVVRVYEHLGLKDELLRESYIWHHGTIRSVSGRILGRLDGARIAAAAGAPMITTTRRHMQNVLRAALPGDIVKYGVGLSEVAQTPEGCVVTLSDGSTDTYALVIGADGASSLVRDAIMGPTQLCPDGNISFQAVIDRQALRAPDHKDLVQSFTEVVAHAGSVGFGLNNNRSVNIFFNLPQVTIADTSAPKDIVKLLARRFAHFPEPVPDLIAAINPHELVRYHPADKALKTGWSLGRLTLVGDAAHPCLQYVGQGGGMALESAVCLAAVLAQAAEHATDIAAALSRYETLRLPRVRTVHSEARRMGSLTGLRNRALCLLRDTVVPLVPDRFKSRAITEIHTGDFLP